MLNDNIDLPKRKDETTELTTPSVPEETLIVNTDPITQTNEIKNTPIWDEAINNHPSLEPVNTETSLETTPNNAELNQVIGLEPISLVDSAPDTSPVEATGQAEVSNFDSEINAAPKAFPSEPVLETAAKTLTVESAPVFDQTPALEKDTFNMVKQDAITDEKLNKKLKIEKQITDPTTEKKKTSIVASLFIIIIIIAILIAAIYFFISQGIVELPSGFNLPFLSTTTTKASNNDPLEPPLTTLTGVYKESNHSICPDIEATLTLKENNQFIFEDVKLIDEVCEAVTYEGTYTNLNGSITLKIDEINTLTGEYLTDQTVATIVITGTAGQELKFNKIGA